MSKYIIDIPDGIEWGVITCRTEDGFYNRDFDSLEELNSDYINEHYGELQDEAYQAGMDKAWEVAQKIMNMPDPPYWDVFCEYKNELFKKLSASEAIAKLKDYEDKHSDRIEAGDIVDRYIDGKFDSRGIYLGGNGEIWDCLFWANTLPITLAYPKGQFKKTGKHYDIQSILEAMRK